ncbi:MAG: hypothetical protein HY042_07855 [Spirochaetia bacterium]|nr:hypothetical protein [Spirochaetia bacterium]
MVRSVFVAAGKGALLLVLLSAAGCSAYDFPLVRTALWSGGVTSDLQSVGLGYFDGRPPAQRLFLETLGFSLREVGFRVREPGETMAVVGQAALPSNRALSSDELLQLSGRYASRVFLQGRIEEARVDRLVDTVVDVMVVIAVHDMKTGEKSGEIMGFGRELKHFGGEESLRMSRRISQRLMEMTLRP